MAELKKGPWYNYHDEWKAKAIKYMECMLALRMKPEIQVEMFTFMEYNISKVIFESNLIEGVGLSAGETRKILDKYFPQIPSDFLKFHQATLNLKDSSSLIISKVGKLLGTYKQLKLDKENIIPSISMSHKSRKIREVTTHFSAMLNSISLANEYLLDNFKNIIFEATSKNNKPVTIKGPNFKFKIQGRKEVKLFTAENIKNLHKILAEELLPVDAGVKEGEYRIDNRIAGWDITFPAPELIPQCMNEFYSQSDKILKGDIGKTYDPFVAAAKISHHFVKIHPFPDFNGRLSRIIMNMVLMTNFCPFPVAIRGNKKEKHRYFVAIKRANGGDLKPLVTMICMQFVQTVEELNSHLQLAGLPSIEKIFKSEKDKQKKRK